MFQKLPDRIRVNPSPSIMIPHFSALPALLSRALQALRTRNDSTHEASDGLEAYLSTATSLHQLEDMQRQWERNHRGTQSAGAY